MITDSTSLPAQVQINFDDKLLAVMTPGLIHMLPAQLRKLPSKNGKTIGFSRYQRLPTFEVPLGPSGGTPPPVVPQRTDLEATVSFYGQWIAVNQQVTLQNSDPVLNAFSELLGLSLRMTEDKLVKDMMLATASMYNCTGGTNGDLPSNVSVSDLDDVTSTLMTNDAWMILTHQEGENKFGTGPISDAFIGLGHTRLSKNLNALPDTIKKWNYPKVGKTIPSEWCAVNNIRILLSSQGAVEPLASALGNDVYDLFVLGMDALANVQQDNYSSRLIYRPAMYSDPLCQNVTIGTTFAGVPKILNDLWLTRVRMTLA